VSPAARPGGAGAVHQFVPALLPRDATGSHTLLLRDALRARGFHSEIFAGAAHEELLRDSYAVTEYPRHANDGDLLVYQFSAASWVADFLAERDDALVLDYHNVTPPEHYAGWEPERVAEARAARVQLRRLAPKALLGLADSHYNEVDLQRAGCTHTEVVPVLVDFARLGVSVTERPDAPSGARWLFVGRVVPSKAQHELVKALWAYRRLYDPTAKLELVGQLSSAPYAAALRSFIASLGLDGAVTLAGELSDEALGARYGVADVYVSASIHEGFGIPLLEAMTCGVPVVARSAGAVSATVGDAGLVLDDPTPAVFAAAVRRVLCDRQLRAALVGAGQERTSRHTLERAADAAVDALAAVMPRRVAPVGAAR
jgi:glycosyltransferase involved in cell wall biosynthesis